MRLHIAREYGNCILDHLQGLVLAEHSVQVRLICVVIWENPSYGGANNVFLDQLFSICAYVYRRRPITRP